MKAKHVLIPLAQVIAIAALISVSVFAGYTLGYQKRVDLVQSHVSNPNKVILPVAEPTGSKITSQKI